MRVRIYILSMMAALLMCIEARTRRVARWPRRKYMFNQIKDYGIDNVYNKGLGSSLSSICGRINGFGEP